MKTPFFLSRTLPLTVFFSFATPIIIAGAILASLGMFGLIPGLGEVAQGCIADVLLFLAAFGNGNPLYGSLTIGCVWGLMGGLFDLCTFYRYQHLI